MLLFRLDQQKFGNCCKYVLFGSIGRRGQHTITLPSHCIDSKLVKGSASFRESPNFYCSIGIEADGLVLSISTDTSPMQSYTRAITFSFAIVTEGAISQVQSDVTGVKFAQEFTFKKLLDTTAPFSGDTCSLLKLETNRLSSNRNDPLRDLRAGSSVIRSNPSPSHPFQRNRMTGHSRGIMQADSMTTERMPEAGNACILKSAMFPEEPDMKEPEFHLGILSLKYRTDPFTITINPESYIHDVTNKINEEFRRRNWEIEEMRILLKGRQLLPDQKISEIDGLTSGDQLHLVTTTLPPPQPPAPNPSLALSENPSQMSPIRENSDIGEITVRSTTLPEESRQQLQSYLRQQQRRMQSVPYNRPAGPGPNRQQSSTHARYNNCAILHRNFDACVEASMNGLDPAQRTRFNDPLSESPPVPAAADLGSHILGLARTVRNWALELNRLSNELIRDVEAPTGTPEREALRRLIQNNMDAARYFHPHLQNLTQFCVPLNMAAPRPLFITETNQTNPNRQPTQNLSRP